jgi:hypothetical protein
MISEPDVVDGLTADKYLAHNRLKFKFYDLINTFNDCEKKYLKI